MLFPNARSAEADDPPPPLGTTHKLLVGVVPGVGALDGLLGIETEVIESHNSLSKARVVLRESWRRPRRLAITVDDSSLDPELLGDLTQHAPANRRPYPTPRELGKLLLESAPTKNRFSSLAATAMVPEPQNGSKTRSPSSVEASSARRTTLKGFWVGW